MRVFTPQHKEALARGIREAYERGSKTSWNKGKKHSIETRKRMSLRQMGHTRTQGEKHYNWMGGISKETTRIREKITKALREKVMLKYRKACFYCLTGESLGIDHIIPLSRGGTNNEENLQILCKRCNARKGTDIHILIASPY